MSIVWHYAPWAHLPAMVESGALRGSNAGGDGELPMLWFSANQQWEPTATKMMADSAGHHISLTFEQQAARFGCIRFGMDAADPRLLNWKDACHTAGTPPKTRRALEDIGRRKGGNPAHWFATTETIPIPELHFQVWNDGWHNTTGPHDMAEVWAETRGVQSATAA